MVAIVVAVGVTRSWRVALLPGPPPDLVLLAVLIGVFGTWRCRSAAQAARLVVWCAAAGVRLAMAAQGNLIVSRDGWATGIGEESVDEMYLRFRLAWLRLSFKGVSLKGSRSP